MTKKTDYTRIKIVEASEILKGVKTGWGYDKVKGHDEQILKDGKWVKVK
jgi:hypothetical protein